MHGFHRVWRFVTSIRFGVVLMLLLMLVMMFATQFEASTSTRAMKHFIYGSAWFDAGVALFESLIKAGVSMMKAFSLMATITHPNPERN